MDIGKSKCSVCGVTIYAWLDSCPHCNAHQDKELLSIADRLRRAGAQVSEKDLQHGVEHNCQEWQSDGTLEALHSVGIYTMGDLLNKTVDELEQMFPNKKVYQRIERFLPYPDTRPITGEERDFKARLLGSVRSEGSNEKPDGSTETECN